jgi:hypothetical protein
MVDVVAAGTGTYDQSRSSHARPAGSAGTSELQQKLFLDLDFNRGSPLRPGSRSSSSVMPTRRLMMGRLAQLAWRGPLTAPLRRQSLAGTPG